MIEWKTGSLFDSGADALVCPVNCVGVMGAGLAKAFDERFPDLGMHYRMLCNRLRMRPGYCRHWAGPAGPTVILLPTKDDWRSPSVPWHIFAGLGSMLVLLDELTDVRSVAIPALGCGLGGLPWDRVRPMILEACQLMPDRDYFLYPPG